MKFTVQTCLTMGKRHSKAKDHEGSDKENERPQAVSQDIAQPSPARLNVSDSNVKDLNPEKAKAYKFMSDVTDKNSGSGSEEEDKKVASRVDKKNRAIKFMVDITSKHPRGTPSREEVESMYRTISSRRSSEQKKGRALEFMAQVTPKDVANKKGGSPTSRPTGGTAGAQAALKRLNPNAGAPGGVAVPENEKGITALRRLDPKNKGKKLMVTEDVQNKTATGKAKTAKPGGEQTATGKALEALKRLNPAAAIGMGPGGGGGGGAKVPANEKGATALRRLDPKNKGKKLMVTEDVGGNKTATGKAKTAKPGGEKTATGAALSALKRLNPAAAAGVAPGGGGGGVKVPDNEKGASALKRLDPKRRGKKFMVVPQNVNNTSTGKAKTPKPGGEQTATGKALEALKRLNPAAAIGMGPGGGGGGGGAKVPANEKGATALRRLDPKNKGKKLMALPKNSQAKKGQAAEGGKPSDGALAALKRLNPAAAGIDVPRAESSSSALKRQDPKRRGKKFLVMPKKIQFKPRGGSKSSAAKGPSSGGTSTALKRLVPATAGENVLGNEEGDVSHMGMDPKQKGKQFFVEANIRQGGGALSEGGDETSSSDNSNKTATEQPPISSAETKDEEVADKESEGVTPDHLTDAASEKTSTAADTKGHTTSTDADIEDTVEILEPREEEKSPAQSAEIPTKRQETTRALSLATSIPPPTSTGTKNPSLPNNRPTGTANTSIPTTSLTGTKTTTGPGSKPTGTKNTSIPTTSLAGTKTGSMPATSPAGTRTASMPATSLTGTKQTPTQSQPQVQTDAPGSSPGPATSQAQPASAPPSSKPSVMATHQEDEGGGGEVVVPYRKMTWLGYLMGLLLIGSLGAMYIYLTYIDARKHPEGAIAKKWNLASFDYVLNILAPFLLMVFIAYLLQKPVKDPYIRNVKMLFGIATLVISILVAMAIKNYRGDLIKSLKGGPVPPAISEDTSSETQQSKRKQELYKYFVVAVAATIVSRMLKSYCC